MKGQQVHEKILFKTILIYHLILILKFIIKKQKITVWMWKKRKLCALLFRL